MMLRGYPGRDLEQQTPVVERQAERVAAGQRSKGRRPKTDLAAHVQDVAVAGRIAEGVRYLTHELHRLLEVVARLQDSTHVLSVIDESSEQIKAEIRALAEQVQRLAEQAWTGGASTIIFDNPRLKADELTQIAGDTFAGFDPGSMTPATTGPVHPPGGAIGPLTVFSNPDASAKTVRQIAGNLYEQRQSSTASSDAAQQPQTILALFANAQDTGQLALLQEARVLRNILETVRDNFELELLPAGTVDDLSQALLHYRPAVVHFSGHGSPEGLLFERGNGQSRLVPRAALVRELSAFAPPLQCVVLNACYSESHISTGFAFGVPYVIGMRGPINDPSAIEFTRGFYEALAAGADIPFAYDRGCNHVGLKNLPGGEIPQLWQSQT
jgi:hypothetical protein